MNRIEVIQNYIDRELINIEDEFERAVAYKHLYGVAQICTLLAMKRKENVELATIAGLLHDLYSYMKSVREDHAHKGAEYARVILEQLKLFSEQEIEIVSNAIYNHSDKADVHGAIDEILKDADVLQHCLYNASYDLSKKEKKGRFERVKNELCIL